MVGGATLSEQERAQRRRIMGDTLEALLGNKEDKVKSQHFKEGGVLRLKKGVILVFHY